MLELPRSINIIIKDYIERSCNYINPKKIKEKDLMRICILANKSVLLKKIVSITFWVFLFHC